MSPSSNTGFVTPGRDRTRHAVPIVLGLLASIVAVDWFLPRTGAQYPDPPFHRLPADFPELIPTTEGPSSRNKKEKEEFTKRFENVNRELTEKGAWSRITPSEKKVLDLWWGEKWIATREAAEKLLRTRPDSVAVRFILAFLHTYSDVDLPRALHHLQIIRSQLEERGRRNPDDRDACEWYLRGLSQERDVLDLLSRDVERLRVTKMMEAVYRPLLADDVFTLIKLHRFDDARKALASVEAEGRWPARALNLHVNLCFELELREEAYQAARKAVEYEPESVALATNLAQCCGLTFRPAESEKAYLQAMGIKTSDSYHSPALELGDLYLEQGRIVEAREAIQRGQRERLDRAPEGRAADSDRADCVISELLLLSGNAAAAERFARRAHQAPERVAFRTESKERSQLVSGLLLWAALHTRLAELSESSALERDHFSGVPGTAALSSMLDVRFIESQLVEQFRDGETLAKLLRPHASFPGYLPCWLQASYLRMVPRGIAECAFDRTRALEQHPGVAPYLDGIQAELALIRGEPREAARLARSARDRLAPEAEKSLRARLAVVGAEAELREGRIEAALELLEGVLAQAPVFLRLLDVRVPVRIEHDGSAAGSSLADRLARSPRLMPHPKGFLVKVSAASKAWRVEMFRLHQARLLEVTVPAEPGYEESAAGAALAFHAKLMSPLIDMSQMDINQLEGSASAAREDPSSESILKEAATPASQAGENR